ncbi:MAG: acylphosphatase [Rhodospirillaceae bacterium]|jgi:acylphosphatase|nr:acylphosphatase [Rhodospirillaceae bacterium]MDP6645235.1 acylphosphatase [Rhodospirillales bacterium]|tara:strand:- start:51 stop:338 length:288 start_codon:yes stop_codon:yes gene_type:complete
MSVNEVCCTARISGTVQMVWYRAWTVEEAEKRGLSGWVRNRKDGTVEALFWGRAKAVEEMLAACRDGPPNAEVTDIVTSPAEPPGKRGFFQLPTE